MYMLVKELPDFVAELYPNKDLVSVEEILEDYEDKLDELKAKIEELKDRIEYLEEDKDWIMSDEMHYLEMIGEI